MLIYYVFDLEKITSFADDNSVVRWGNDLALLITDMVKKVIGSYH